MPINLEKKRARQKRHYERNRAARIELVKQIKRNLIERFQKFKSQLSCKCGESHPACLDFHHRDPKQKHDSVTQMVTDGLSWTRIMEEIDKCDVMCSNCHRKFHYAERHGPA